MDIYTPSDLPGAKPAVNRVADLLTQLRGAGSIEAEVVKLLRDNQLLLTSRLGQILASNKLHYRPGDRVSLRLDDSGQQPVLKVSPPVNKTVSLDSRQYPELVRQLSPDRPLLARVIKVVAQRAEIQLPNQVVKLPRQVAAVRNQLLSLQRNDARQRIEITPLERKAIYKAILKQLVPRQADNAGSSLVKLLDLVNPAAIKAERKPVLRAESARPRQQSGTPLAGERNNSSKPRVDAMLSSGRAKPLTGKPQPGLVSEPGTIASAAPAKGLLSNLAGSRPSPPVPNSARSQADVARAGAGGGTLRQGHSTAAGSSINGLARPKFQTSSKPVTAIDQSVVARVQTGSTAHTRPDRPSPGLRANDANANARATPTPGPHTGVPKHSTITNVDQPAIATRATQVASVPRVNSTALQPLLQLLTRMSDIDGAQVKQWFELARLVKQSRPESASTPALDIFRILKQFSERESLQRELSPVAQQNPRNPADGDTAASRTPAQEAQLLQLREGMKLVEQSLSHNLLQRATLGLQQETQQPLSVSFALPFLDQEQVKPLYIDLAERNQALSDEDKSWEIRLCFDLADLGSISCHLVLEGLTIAASFYAEYAATRERIEAELPQLRQQLSQAGFMPGEFHSYPGRPAADRGAVPTEFTESLVDIEV
jgi:flagellar hook-length control protein FliK